MWRTITTIASAIVAALAVVFAILLRRDVLRLAKDNESLAKKNLELTKAKVKSDIESVKKDAIVDVKKADDKAASEAANDKKANRDLVGYFSSNISKR